MKTSQLSAFSPLTTEILLPSKDISGFESLFKNTAFIFVFSDLIVKFKVLS